MAAQGVSVESIGGYFESHPYPRDARNHLLVDILVLAVWVSVRGFDGPTAIRRETRSGNVTPLRSASEASRSTHSRLPTTKPMF